MPIKLCHLNLARGFRGGERQTELLIRELAVRGIRQRALLRKNQPLAFRLADVPGLELIEAGKPFLRHLPALRGCLAHAHGAKGAHLAHWANRIMGTPYVLTRRVDNRPGDNPITRSVYRRATAIAALSKAIADVLHSHSPGVKVHVIPSACAGLAADAARAKKLREAWGGEYVFGQVGALDDAQKGQLTLIEAARRLCADERGWRFVLVGGGRDEARLRAEAADMDEVIFAGQVENVGDYLAAFDAFVYPSRHEGLGSALLDAMEFGLPIVASAVDGIPEIVEHEREGLLVPAGDADALAAAMLRMRNSADGGAAFSRAGKQRAGDYTAARMADRYLQWYGDLGLDIDLARAG